MDLISEQSVSNEHKMKVALNYFTISTDNQHPHQVKSYKTDDISSSKVYTQFQKVNELNQVIPPTDVASSESFHSCHSFLAFPTLDRSNYDENDKDNVSSCRRKPPKIKTIRDTDLGHKVTMVNAIFLSKGTGEIVPKERSKRTLRKDKPSEWTHSKETSGIRSSDIQTPICTEAYTCNIDKPLGLKIFNNTGRENGKKGNLFMHNPIVDIYKRSEDKLEDSYHSSDSCEQRKEDYKSNIIGIMRNLGSKLNPKTLNADCCKDDALYFEKSLNYNTKQTVCRKQEGSSPEIIHCKSKAVTEPTIGSACKRDTFRGTIVHRKHMINKSYEVEHLEPICTKTFSIIISPAKFETDYMSNTVKNYTPVGLNKYKDKLIVKLPEDECESKIAVDESYLKLLIEESFQKLKEKENNGKESDVTFNETAEEESSVYDSEEENLDYSTDSDGSESNKTSDSDISLKRCNEDQERGVVSRSYCGLNPFPDNVNGPESTIQQSGQAKPGLVFDDKFLPPVQRNCLKRKTLERQCNLPVIEEETSNSLVSLTSEEDLDPEYCLVDSAGKPIYLFDHKGLPLTDRRGRPLRTAKGLPLMKCDQNGIPLIDYEDCTVYDMFGRTPNHKDFDPSMAPKMPTTNRLASCDGKPLLLFDTKDRPLTSVSGTMLVDSSGRGLIRLASKLDDDI